MRITMTNEKRRELKRAGKLCEFITNAGIDITKRMRFSIVEGNNKRYLHGTTFIGHRLKMRDSLSSAML